MMVLHSIVSRWPASTLRCIAGPSDDSTPITFAAGLCDLTAIETPEISPPPPIGTTTASTSGQSCTISRPDRSLPGDQLLVVERMHVGQSLVAHQLLRLLVRLVPDRAVQHDLRAVSPRRRDLATAWRSSPCTPPRECRGSSPPAPRPARDCRPTSRPRRAASARRDISANLFSGPRILYDPTRWKSSALSRTSYPVISLSWRDVSSGVCLMCGAIRSRTAWKSCSVSVNMTFPA